MALGPDGRWARCTPGDLPARQDRRVRLPVRTAPQAGRSDSASVRTVGAGWGSRRVPDKAAPAFGRRRIEIEVVMAEHGVRSAHGAQTQPRSTAARQAQIVDEGDPAEGWRRRAGELGFTGKIPDRPAPHGRGERRGSSALLTEQDAAAIVARCPGCRRDRNSGLDYDATIRLRADRTSPARSSMSRPGVGRPGDAGAWAGALRRAIDGPGTVRSIPAR